MGNEVAAVILPLDALESVAEAGTEPVLPLEPGRPEQQALEPAQRAATGQLTGGLLAYVAGPQVEDGKVVEVRRLCQGPRRPGGELPQLEAHQARQEGRACQMLDGSV